MKISIVTPSFNQANFIARTIDSVINQTGKFLIEFIIMDGGSTDGTVDLLQEYQEKITTNPQYQHIEFIWYSGPDKGQSDAINKGLQRTTGDIVTYLNSDDTYEPRCLTRVAQTLSQPNIEWCYGKCYIIDEYDKHIRGFLTAYKNILGKRWSYRKLLTENFISQMTVFWTRQAFEDIGLFNTDEHLCMDYEYWLRLGAKYTPQIIPYYLANFRFYYTSKSGSMFTQQFKDQLRLAKHYARGKYRFSILLHSILYWRTICIYKLLHLLKI